MDTALMKMISDTHLQLSGYCIAAILSLCITIPMSMHQENFQVIPSRNIALLDYNPDDHPMRGKLSSLITIMIDHQLRAGPLSALH